MKVMNPTRAMGTSLIALGLTAGFALEASASSLNGIYEAKEICKVTVVDTDNDDAVINVYGKHTTYGVRLQEGEDSDDDEDLDECLDEVLDSTPELEDGGHCKDVTAKFVSLDGKTKVIYDGAAYFAPPFLDEHYRAKSVTALGLGQCYSLEEHSVRHVDLDYNFVGSGKNFVAHALADEIELEEDLEATEDCKVLMVKTRDREIKKLMKKHEIPSDFECDF